MTDKNLLVEVLDGTRNYKNDPALKQGIQFNKEQTELNSTREGFSSKGKATLAQLDKSESSSTGKLEQLFNTKMSNYSRQFNARVAGALQQPVPPPIYGINTSEQIYTKNSQGSNGGWSMPNGGSRLMNISATGKTHLWGVNSNDTIYKCQRPCLHGEWEEVNGGLTQLSADDQYVYGVQAADNTIWRRNEDGTGNWERIPGGLTNISASGKDWVWGVNRNGNVYRCAKPCGGLWVEDDGVLKQAAADDNYVWGVNSANMIFKKPVNGSGTWDWSPSTRGAGTSGANVNRLLWVSPSAPNYVWGVGEDRRMWFCKKPCTDGNWETMGIYTGGTQVEGDNGAGVGGGTTETDLEHENERQVAALGASNDELMSMAKVLWERTSDLHKVSGKASKDVEKKRRKLRKKMELLQKRREILNTIKGANVTLDEKLSARRLDLDSIYIHYVVWFAAAAALTAVVAHKMIG